MKELFNNGWQFKLKGEDTWRDVEIPHDWLIYDTHNLYKSDVGCYRKVFDFGPVEPGQNVCIRFDGVYMDSTLYINGEWVGEWKNGYTAFEHNLLGLINPGENEILLEVNYKSPNSRWYSGAGVYRDCWLIIGEVPKMMAAESHEDTPLIYKAANFISDGIYVTPKRMSPSAAEQKGKNPPSGYFAHTNESGNWLVAVTAEVEGTWCETRDGINYTTRIMHSRESLEKCGYTIRHSIIGPDGASIYYKTQQDGSLLVENPHLWDIDCPTCYTLKSDLVLGGKISDTVYTRFGFREIAITPTDGFWLNGRRVQINGVCQHHDLGALGAAFNKDALRRQLAILKKMGVNAIRTAHNPPAAAFIELTDEMGLLVMSEIADMWKRPKTTYDYARFFDEWIEKDIAAWVRRDRNCPSIVMWSVGNEVYDTHADAEDGAATLRRLMELVKLHDPNGHGYVTLCSNYMPWENTQACADIIKLIGYNYAEYLYHSHHTAHPSWIIYGGETASTVQSRGIYHFPLNKSLLADDDLQCSALGNSTTSWGAKTSEACITDHRDAPFTMGQFLWTGTDYIGEPTPYHTKNSYFGQVDTAGFPKDSYYIYQSAWTDYRQAPMIHLFPVWDWSPGQPIDVRIASNAPMVELFLNDESLGQREIDHAKGMKLTADYIVPYEPGCIKAVAYNENGEIIAEATRHSFGDAEKLVLTHTQYGELIFTEITALDVNGNPVENATNRVKVNITGGVIIGMDNGDSADYDQYKTNSRRLFSGKLLVITKGINGAIPIIDAEIDPTDIPIRKIELTAQGHSVTATTYPYNATYQELTWRLADVSGIDSPLGRLEIDDSGRAALLMPKGDGQVYIRCQAANGRPHPTLISVLPIEITGYGKPFLDPYGYISGGLYNLSNVPLTNGNERGVATLRDGESHVGFADLDFGPYGSDEVTMDLFPLDKNPFPIEIWLGMPSSGRKLCTVVYDKGSIWNTYQEVTYKLPERLTGVQTLCLVFRLKVHIKGFRFKKETKALTKISFAAYEHIYGDSFAVKDTTVEGIGNNVTIDFEHMSFESEAKTIEISWRSMLDTNTIRMVFVQETGEEIVNLLTLPCRKEYGYTRLQLAHPLKGAGTVRFIFLPGSDIDLEWFRLK